MSRIFIFTLTILLISVGWVIFYNTSESRKNDIDKPIIVDPVLQKILNEYEAYIDESLCQTGTPGAAIAIVKDNTTIYLQGFGIRDINTNKLVDTHTSFRMASVSKSITSSLAGSMVEDSVFLWDDPVIMYIEDFILKPQSATKQVMIKHLFSHTTGFPYHAYTNLIEEGSDLSKMIRKLQTVELISPVGKIYSYQNVAFSIIEKVIESATGKNFEKNMQERIFDPLHMEDASITYNALLTNPNAAQPHVRYKRKWKKIPLSRNYYNASPAGGVNASASDMANWMKALLGKRENIIRPSTIKQLFQPIVKTSVKNKNFHRWRTVTEAHYGLGWRILSFDQDTLAYHGGYVNGYRSELAIYPKEKIAICVLANGPGRFVNRAIPSFLKIYTRHTDPL